MIINRIHERSELENFRKNQKKNCGKVYRRENNSVKIRK